MGRFTLKSRMGLAGRGVVIGLFILAYGFLTNYPQASYTWMFLLGAALQIAILLVRKFLPPDQGARAQDIFEEIANGITVLSFAIGVFGSIARVPEAL